MGAKRSALIEETDGGFKVSLDGEWSRMHVDQVHSAMRRQLLIHVNAKSLRPSEKPTTQEEANNG